MKSIQCNEDWRKCGHCRVNSYSPGEDYPRCDKAGRGRTLVGGDMCPNAPWPAPGEGSAAAKPCAAMTRTRREQYDSYDDHVRLNLAQRAEFEAAVLALVDVLRRAGVTWSGEGEPGCKPMSDVNRIEIMFRGNGDFRVGDAVIGSAEMCGVHLCLEPKPEEENDNG